jgi:thiol-disulfide isomerase/thioredoxin
MGQLPQTSRFVSFFKVVVLAVSFLAFVPTSVNAQDGVIDLAGKAVDPFAVARGKAVVLIFIRTDCPISNRYAPAIQQLSEQHAEKAEFFLIYPDKKESGEAIRKHAQEFGYRIASLRDPQHVLVKRSRARITPEVAVFDAERKLIYHGRIDNLYEDFGHARKSATTHELEDAVQAAINGKPLRTEATSAVGCYISDVE